jgi:hypothetical protein
MSGIALAPEYYWMEAGCPNNVIIKNNRITNCMFESTMWGTYQFAPLVVVSEAPNGGVAPVGASSNISIYDNIITDCPLPCIGVTSTDGLRIYNNEINPATWSRDHGYNNGFRRKDQIVTIACRNVETEPTAINPTIISDSKIVVENNRITIAGETSNEIARIESYDLTGRKMFSKLFSLREGVSIENLGKGISFVTVYYNNNAYTAKIATY